MTGWIGRIAVLLCLWAGAATAAEPFLIDKVEIIAPASKGGGRPWDVGGPVLGLPDIYACFERPGAEPECFGPCRDNTACVIDPDRPIAAPEGPFRLRVMDADALRHDWIFTVETSGAKLRDPGQRVMRERDPVDGRVFEATFHPVEDGGCSNSATLSCDIYPSCFARYCPCEASPDEYFMTYGYHYCRRFMFAPGFTQKGVRWRNSTMRCLQEAIVPELDLSEPPRCDCRRMRRIAFDSHVACYTQPGASICLLPEIDLLQIQAVIDTSDLLSREGLRQMLAVAEVCLGQASAAARDDAARVWRDIERSLGVR